MKALFFAICLLNVLFFFWELHAGGLRSPLEVRSGLPAIVLASERETARRCAAISAYLDQAALDLQARQAGDVWLAMKPVDESFFRARAAVTSKSAVASRQPNQLPPMHCYEAGPFGDPLALARWAKDRHVKAFKPAYKEAVIAADFQVYYPPAKDAEQLRINSLMLKAKGFVDVWPVNDGELKGAVSLGVFREKPRAVLFKAQLAEQGVRAEIRQRSKTQTELFVRFMATSVSPQNAAYTRLPAADCRSLSN